MDRAPPRALVDKPQARERRVVRWARRLHLRADVERLGPVAQARDGHRFKGADKLVRTYFECAPERPLRRPDHPKRF